MISIDTIWLAVLGYVGFMLKSIPGTILYLYKQRYAFSATFNSRDYLIYKAGNEWILSLDSKILKRSIQLLDSREDEGGAIESIDYGTYWVRLDKFTFIHINKYRLDGSKGEPQDGITVTIIGKNNLKYRTDIFKRIESIYNCDKLVIYTNRWDRTLAPKKSMDDIFFHGKKTVIKSIENWKNNKPIYDKHGIIHKLGILLYGEPGTGKTSVARAIASDLNWRLHTINIKMTTSKELMNWIVGIPINSVVLFEDVDCAISSRDKNNIKPEKEYDENYNNVQQTDTTANNCDMDMLDIMLNILDGVMSPTGVIFIATTNYIDRLDPAFKREGRFDCKVELGKIDKKLAIDMCDRFGQDSDYILNGESFPINPSYLQAKILRQLFKVN